MRDPLTWEAARTVVGAGTKFLLELDTPPGKSDYYLLTHTDLGVRLEKRSSAADACRFALGRVQCFAHDITMPRKDVQLRESEIDEALEADGVTVLETEARRTSGASAWLADDLLFSISCVPRPSWKAGARSWTH
ncbi:hypothetical protein Tco_1476019 [Tanacetum coccineum]